MIFVIYFEKTCMAGKEKLKNSMHADYFLILSKSFEIHEKGRNH